MKKISIQSLNSIFNVVEELSSTVIWIRDNDYTKQIYLNDNYEKVWEREAAKLYNNPKSFYESLYIENNYDMQANKFGLTLFRIKTRSHGVRHIRDQHYLLADEKGETIGRMGFATVVDEQEWLAQYENLHIEHSPNLEIQNNITELVKREFRIMPTSSENAPKETRSLDDLIEQYCQCYKIRLTPRERTCLFYLLSGNVPKIIAAAMNISTRTVEFHIENIKNKARCKNTLQLISQVNSLQK